MTERPDPFRETSPEADSKSQRKRDARALFKLGQGLVELSGSALASLPMDEELRAAIDEARHMRSHGARKRQLGFIARLLRHSEIEALVQALEHRRGEARAEIARHHRVEAWRDGLLGQGDALLAVLIGQCPDADHQALRTLLRNARKEASLGRPPASSRKLFQMLRELDSAQALPPLPGSAD